MVAGIGPGPLHLVSGAGQRFPTWNHSFSSQIVAEGSSRTGTRRDRPGLREALAACRAGDSLVVTKLDAVARSLPDARDIAEDLTRREVRLSLGGSGPGAVSEPQRRDHARRDDARWARSQGGTDQGLMEFATGLVAQSPP